jgi:hypothetical protein
MSDLSIWLPDIMTNYEVFANGVRIGGIGKMPPNPIPYSNYASQIYALPIAGGMTDGVVEAQDATGHLFGFDRIAEMLRGGIAAAALANAAQDFGQEDDITVLTVAGLAPAA